MIPNNDTKANDTLNNLESPKKTKSVSTNKKDFFFVKRSDSPLLDERGVRYEYARPMWQESGIFAVEDPNQAKVQEVFDTNLYIGRADEVNDAHKYPQGVLSKRDPNFNFYESPMFKYSKDSHFPTHGGPNVPGFEYTRPDIFFYDDNPFCNLEYESIEEERRNAHKYCGGKHPELPQMIYKFRNDEFAEGNFSSCRFRKKNKIRNNSDQTEERK